MRIGINTRFLLNSKMEGFGWYTFEIVKRLVERHPEHQFIFFFDRAYDEKFIFGKNVEPVVLAPQARHPILHWIWFEWSIKRALKKYRCDLFFSPDGYLSLGSSIPQIPVIHDINFEYYPKDLPFFARYYFRYFFPKFAKKAKKIITVSSYSKLDISRKYEVAPDNIYAIWNGASDAFSPLEKVEQAAVRQKYTEGKDYFLFVGSLNRRKNVHRLFKAYEQYRNKVSEPKELLIVGQAMWSTKEFDFSSKEGIRFTGHVKLEELTQIVGSAYALTYVPYFEGFGIPLVEAMRCGTPILSGNLTALPEVAGDAAIYCDPFKVDDITEKMVILHENKELHSQLSARALERSHLFSWDKSAEQVWEVLADELSKIQTNGK